MNIAILPLLLSASLMLPASFVAPKGWVAKTPPAGTTFDFIWLSPHYGVDGNGENLMVMSHPVSAVATLEEEVHHAAGELSQDRSIVDSHAEPTCHGLQAGWTFDARLPLPNGKVASQVYHLTIVNRRAYAFIFTHAAGDRIEQTIGNSIQSICPDNHVF